ncbi:ABC transporter permease [Oceanobacillus massiliensis]|uniref:ABC transporter permease n=1 Tax=Oceanobacillus massiliensis TaxID=1465765 RepID=UPI0030196064
MISIIHTRWTLLKKQWRSLLFWLLLPIIATVIIIHITSSIQEDSKIPVGIVMEEHTSMAKKLAESLQDSPLIEVVKVTEQQARTMIETHELDSAFIVEKGYAEQIQRGTRNHLITGYRSNLSFAYTPVSEMVMSYVQQDAGKSRAAHTIITLAENLEKGSPFTYSEIIAKIQDVQENENLLRTAFSFADNSHAQHHNEFTLWNIWGLWAIFSVLSSLMLSDWIIKEKNSGLLPRFAFIRFTHKSYLLQNLGFYIMMQLLFDLLAVIAFRILLDETFSWRFLTAMAMFRLLCSIGSFLLALLFKNVYLYYSISFAIVLFLTIASGAVLPVEGLTSRLNWLVHINPLHPFLSQEFWNPWLLILFSITSIWFFKGEKWNA